MLAEKIQTTYYRGIASDDVAFTLRHIAQLCAEEIAAMATTNAFENSRGGETTFANDQFISTYTNQTVSFSTDLQSSYVALPASPAGIPATSGITIIPYGARKVQIIMMKQKDRFSQSFLDPIPNVILAWVENNQILLDGPTAYMPAAVNLKLVGAIPNGNLLSAPINCPKSYEPVISENVIKRLLATSSRPRNIVENLEGEVAP